MSYIKLPELDAEALKRIANVTSELSVLSRSMQTLLDMEGKTAEGREKIRILKVHHDRLLSELNTLQGLRFDHS